MFKKLYRRIVVWRHRNDCVVWQVRKNGMVPGLDCPWEAGDTFELYSRNGTLCGSGKIDVQFANDFNVSLRWNKNFHAE